MKLRIFLLIVAFVSKNIFASMNSSLEMDVMVVMIAQEVNIKFIDINKKLWEDLDILDGLSLCGIEPALDLIEAQEDTERKILKNTELLRFQRLKIIAQYMSRNINRQNSDLSFVSSTAAPAAQSSAAPFASSASAPANVQVLHVNDGQPQPRSSGDEQQKEEGRKQETMHLQANAVWQAEIQRREALERQRQQDDDYVPQQQSYQYVPQPRVQYH